MTNSMTDALSPLASRMPRVVREHDRTPGEWELDGEALEAMKALGYAGEDE